MFALYNTEDQDTKFTYEMSHIDIDTSCEKVVDLSHQTIITCLKQLYLLKQKVRVEGRVGGSSHVMEIRAHGTVCGVFMDTYSQS